MPTLCLLNAYSNYLTPPSGGSQQFEQRLSSWDAWAFASDPPVSIHLESYKCMLRFFLSESPGLHGQPSGHWNELSPSECSLTLDEEKIPSVLSCCFNPLCTLSRPVLRVSDRHCTPGGER